MTTETNEPDGCPPVMTEELRVTEIKQHPGFSSAPKSLCQQTHYMELKSRYCVTLMTKSFTSGGSFQKLEYQQPLFRTVYNSHNCPVTTGLVSTTQTTSGLQVETSFQYQNLISAYQHISTMCLYRLRLQLCGGLQHLIFTASNELDWCYHSHRLFYQKAHIIIKCLSCN